MAQELGLLGRFVEAKRAELEQARLRVPQSILEKSIQPRVPGKFRRALLRRQENGFGSQGETAVIAELKKASPSRGTLRPDYDPVGIAKDYERAGARALSVLTDQQFFSGSLDDLKRVRAATSLPILRKDFTLSEYHLYEAAAAGADAVLLIVAILQPQELAHLLAVSRSLGLDTVVEVHAAEELRVAVETGSDVIGINNRNLSTFEVSLEVSLRLIDFLPDEITAVSESGLRSAEDLEKLRAAGFDAFLIGERFMTEADPGAALARLLAEVNSRVSVKADG